MCGGLEFLRRPERLSPGELTDAIRGSGGGIPGTLRVYFPNPKAALPVDGDPERWLPWGRRKEQPGDWPEGGWARLESLGKPYWLRWKPEEVLVRPQRWMEKDRARISRWFDPEGRGILCLCLAGAPGSPLYVVTEPATGDYLVHIHDRQPVLRD